MEEQQKETQQDSQNRHFNNAVVLYGQARSKSNVEKKKELLLSAYSELSEAVVEQGVCDKYEQFGREISIALQAVGVAVEPLSQE